MSDSHVTFDFDLCGKFETVFHSSFQAFLLWYTIRNRLACAAALHFAANNDEIEVLASLEPFANPLWESPFSSRHVPLPFGDSPQPAGTSLTECHGLWLDRVGRRSCLPRVPACAGLLGQSCAMCNNCQSPPSRQKKTRWADSIKTSSARRHLLRRPSEEKVNFPFPKIGKCLTPTQTNRARRKSRNVLHVTSHYHHGKHRGAELTTTCVMLSGRVSMVSPPPRTAALLLLGRPGDGCQDTWGWLSPPVDPWCCWEVLLSAPPQKKEN